MILDLSNLSTPQLRSIKQILIAGVPSKAESKVETVAQDTENLEVAEKLCDCKVLDDAQKENDNMQNIERIEALENEVKTLKDERDALASEKSEQASQVETLTKELNDYREELETLRKFKTDTEEAAEKAERIKSIKTLLEEAGVETDVDAEADYWLNMSEDVLKLTISKMGELSKGAKASASIKVPQIPSEETDTVETVRQGLRDRKNRS